MLEAVVNQVRTDSRSRYYVTNSDDPYVWVFDADGSALERLGRYGQGPGEFQRISAFWIGPDDRLHVFDPMQQRMTVFSPRYELERTVALDFRPDLYDVASAGDRMVLNANLRSADRGGLPLHLVDPSGGEILRSFGAEPGAGRPKIAHAHRRAVGPTGGDAVWSGYLNGYVLERWDAEGRMTDALKRDVEWFPPHSRSEVRADTPPQPHLRAIREVDGELWVIVSVPGPDWRETVSSSTEDPRFFTVTDRNVYENTVIEVIGLRERQVRVSSRLPRYLVGFAAPGVVYGPEYDATGNPRVGVWELSVEPPASGGPGSGSTSASGSRSGVGDPADTP